MQKTSAKPKPFVKWAGGKRQILNRLISLAPKKFNNYHEPFLGGGALFYGLQPETAFLSDSNVELINTYNVIKYKVDELIDSLYQHTNTEEYFLKIRAIDRNPNYYKLSDVDKASRFLYLNRTCFNGLYRVNSENQFNTPYGKYRSLKFNTENLRECHNIFNVGNIEFSSDDFRSVLDKSEYGDFVYFDPPYAPESETSNFTSYTNTGFSMNDQKDLFDLIVKLTDKGIKVMLSNSTKVAGLYKDFNQYSISENQSINSNGSKRSGIEKLIITNY